MRWKRSSRCNWEPPQCVEVAIADHGVAIRDGKRAGRGPILEVSVPAWEGFIAHLR